MSANCLEQQISLSNSDEQDKCDYLLKIGKLLNAIGDSLFDAWQKSNKKEHAKLCNQLVESMENKMTFVLKIFNHAEEDDDISESVSEYCMNYM